jgi:plastocyanin
MKTFAVALSVLALGIAGCGGDDDESSDSAGSGSGSAETAPQPTPTQEGSGGSGSSGGGATTLKIAADPDGALAFDKDTLSAKAGEVTIEMDNPSSLPHAVEIEGNGVEEAGEVVEKGGVSTATAELEAGTYKFYCPVGGHEAGGMVGELTVE